MNVRMLVSGKKRHVSEVIRTRKNWCASGGCCHGLGVQYSEYLYLDCELKLHVCGVQGAGVRVVFNLDRISDFS